jgi:hypothetical protein
LSTVEKHLIENFAGIAVVINDINARLLLGEEVDLLELCTLSTSAVRYLICDIKPPCNLMYDIKTVTV